MASSALAGQPQQAPQSASQVKPASTEPQVQDIGVSLDRIRRKLREIPPTMNVSRLKLDYHVDVIGRAPRIGFSDFDTGRHTAVQYGGMTHAEFLKITAPPWRKSWP
jgi:hypothetical protein